MTDKFPDLVKSFKLLKLDTMYRRTWITCRLSVHIVEAHTALILFAKPKAPLTHIILSANSQTYMLLFSIITAIILVPKCLFFMVICTSVFAQMLLLCFKRVTLLWHNLSVCFNLLVLNCVCVCVCVCVFNYLVLNYVF